MATVHNGEERYKDDETAGAPGPGDICYADAEHYLETLIGPAWASTPLVFQTFDDDRTRKDQRNQTAARVNRTRTDPYAHIYQGTWAQHQDVSRP